MDLRELRWELPIHLMSGLFDVRLSRSALQRLNLTDFARDALVQIGAALQTGIRDRYIQSTPHPVLLSRKFYNEELLSRFGNWALFWLLEHPSVAKCLDRRDPMLLHVYIITPKGTAGEDVDDARQFVNEHFCKDDEAIALVNLARDWLCTFLPHCFSKINRVSFGLLHPRDCERLARLQGKEKSEMPLSRKLLAVPFVAKVSGLVTAIFSKKPSFALLGRTESFQRIRASRGW